VRSASISASLRRIVIAVEPIRSMARHHTS
jgi:hypothetical protein